jgi:hypothetical protein
VAQAVYPWKGAPSQLKIYKLENDMRDQTSDVMTTVGGGNVREEISGLEQYMWPADLQGVGNRNPL